jgi:hypothetical protein
MEVVTFELRYTLTRRQRFSALGIGAVLPVPFAVLLFAFFVWRAVASAATFDWFGLIGFGILALAVYVVFRGPCFALVNILRRTQAMDIRVEANGLGVMVRGDRWWLFLDGLTGIEQRTPGLWTLTHWNGSIVHIPADVISPEQLDFLRTAMERGRTPEGVQAVIDRGRRLAEMEKDEPVTPPGG